MWDFWKILHARMNFARFQKNTNSKTLHRWFKKMIRNTNDSNKHLVKDLTLHSNPLTNPRYVYFRYAVIKEGLWYTPCEHVTLGWIMWKFSRKVLKIFLEIFMKMLENFQETLVENFHENEKKIFKKIFTWKFSSVS